MVLVFACCCPLLFIRSLLLPCSCCCIYCFYFQSGVQPIVLLLKVLFVIFSLSIIIKDEFALLSVWSLANADPQPLQLCTSIFSYKVVLNIF